MSKKYVERDIEMGDVQESKGTGGGGGGGGVSLCFDCSDSVNSQADQDKNETGSQATLDAAEMKARDEDDLGDNQDEYQENKVIDSYAEDSDNEQLFNIQNEFIETPQNRNCFSVDPNFLKIIDKVGNEERNTGSNSTEDGADEYGDGGEDGLRKILRGQESFDSSESNRQVVRESEVVILHNIDDFWEANSESEDEDYLDKNAKHPLDQISFEKLKKKVYKDFDVNLIHRYSSALDILASYIKYHVIIYTEASYYCNFMLNLFMVPAILFSTVCSVITGIAHNQDNMAIIVASLNGFIAFLLAIINYLKLDASAEAHKISAYQYSKLKNYIEFSSGEILLFQDPIITNKNFISEQIKMWENNNEVAYADPVVYKRERNKKLKEYHKYKSQLEKKLIDTIQNKIFEIKKSLKNIEDSNNFILPKHINRRYYNIYNINVFSYIKSVENYKLILLNNLRNVKNEIRFYRSLGNEKLSTEKMEKIRTLYHRKNNILTEFLELNKGFMLIDTMFQQEIKNISIRKKYWAVFKIQGFLKMIIKCCCCRDSSLNILPAAYKKCTHVGFIDEDGRYLLDKILRSNNTLALE